jgi:hypothetical protein
MPAEPDHLDLVSQKSADRQHDRFGPYPAPLDDAADGRVADPPRHGLDSLLLLGQEPPPQRFLASAVPGPLTLHGARLASAGRWPGDVDGPPGP